MSKNRFPIYNRYLKIKQRNKISIFMASFMPFLQAFLGSVLQVVIINNQILSISLVSMVYWSMFALNGKRIALGGWKAITAFILFATIGTVTGYLSTMYFFA